MLWLSSKGVNIKYTVRTQVVGSLFIEKLEDMLQQVTSFRIKYYRYEYLRITDTKMVNTAMKNVETEQSTATVVGPSQPMHLLWKSPTVKTWFNPKNLFRIEEKDKQYKFKRINQILKSAKIEARIKVLLTLKTHDKCVTGMNFCWPTKKDLLNFVSMSTSISSSWSNCVTWDYCLSRVAFFINVTFPVSTFEYIQQGLGEQHSEA